jgi:DNA-binding XRE family transcriptional regulator
MKRRSIATYLRTLRRRSALSQDDVAFLLGTFVGTRVSRHETGVCAPRLEVALVYALIFDVSIETMYEDDLRRLERGVCERAERLCESLAHRLRDPLRDEKRAALRRLIRRCRSEPST